MTVGTAALERLSIDGPAGRLEAIVEDPKLAADGYAVLCHPHPLHGGTMDNKVVVTLARAFRETGIPTLRFNFRGVGSSAGTYDEGNGRNRGCRCRCLVRSAALAGRANWCLPDSPSERSWHCAWRSSGAHPG